MFWRTSVTAAHDDVAKGDCGYPSPRQPWGACVGWGHGGAGWNCAERCLIDEMGNKLRSAEINSQPALGAPGIVESKPHSNKTHSLLHS